MSSEEVSHYTKKDLIYLGIFIASLMLMYVITAIFNNLRTGVWDLTTINPSFTPEAMTYFGIFFLSPFFFLALYYFGESVYEGILFMISLASGSQN